jgi:hypothetical protein
MNGSRSAAVLVAAAALPGFRLRFFLAIHDTGVARHVLNPVAVDARGQRIGAQP